MQPSLLLLDEPTAAFDYQAATQMMELVKRILQTWKIPAILISHDHEINTKYADTIYLLHDGSLSCAATKNKFFGRDDEGD